MDSESCSTADLSPKSLNDRTMSFSNSIENFNNTALENGYEDFSPTTQEFNCNVNVDQYGVDFDNQNFYSNITVQENVNEYNDPSRFYNPNYNYQEVEANYYDYQQYSTTQNHTHNQQLWNNYYQENQSYCSDTQLKNYNCEFDQNHLNSTQFQTNSYYNPYSTTQSEDYYWKNECYYLQSDVNQYATNFQSLRK